MRLLCFVRHGEAYMPPPPRDQRLVTVLIVLMLSGCVMGVVLSTLFFREY